MVPKLHSSGQSFKGLAQYLAHDPKAKTSERVAWTHTLNCANDNVLSAVDEMLWTYRDAELLKKEAGVRGGGRTLEKPVKHFSLNWAPDERPTQEHMIATAEDFLKFMGWHEHQAVLVAQTDKEYSHVHCMVNAVHPETGLKLDDGFEKRRAQEWALEYERANQRIYCEERLKDLADREASPTRATWLALKESEKQHEHAEKQRREFDADYLARLENRKIMSGEEWGMLKEHQRHEREAFFVDGKTEFKELRTSIYREVREEFREQWAEFYEAKRNGTATDELAEMRRGLIDDQKTVLDERRHAACADLRTERDATYRELLDGQKDMRAELTARQEQGLSSPHLMDLAYPRADDRGDTADRAPVVRDGSERGEGVTDYERGSSIAARDIEEEDAFAFSSPSSSPGGLRPAPDIAANIGLGLLGGIGTLGESLFDGFFGGTPAPASRHAEPRQAAPRREQAAPNPFAVAAEAARKDAERQQREENDRAYWDERRGRSRD